MSASVVYGKNEDMALHEEIIPLDIKWEIQEQLYTSEWATWLGQVSINYINGTQLEIIRVFS